MVPRLADRSPGAKESFITSHDLNPSRPLATAKSHLLWVHIVWAILVHIGALAAPFTFSWSGLIVCVGLYLIAGFGVTMGYHRLLTHRSFQTPRIIEYLLTLFGSLAVQGGPLIWVAVHRAHHQHSDDEGDPHTPRKGMWWAHILWWMTSVPALSDEATIRHYTNDLYKDPVHRFFDKYHALFTVVLAGILFAIGEWVIGGVGLSWVIWGVFVRITVLYHATYLVNSAAHRWGYQSHQTGDDSRNSWWVALVSLGEGWHNNHHAYPRSAKHGLRWWEVDVTYWAIRLMSFLGLARQIHVPGKVIRNDGKRRQKDRKSSK